MLPFLKRLLGGVGFDRSHAQISFFSLIHIWAGVSRLSVVFLMVMMGGVFSASAQTCSDLPEDDCILSSECILEQATGKDYVCRSPRNTCERGFEQWGGVPNGQESCLRISGCLFAPGECYCPPFADCVCGGGEPPSCRPETISANPDHTNGVAGPFVYWIENGSVRKSQTLRLRPSETLQVMRRALAPWPRLRAFENFGTPRLGASPNDIADALDLAWRTLEIASVEVPNSQNLPRDAQSRLWSSIDWARSLVQAYGDNESATKLLALRNQSSFFDDRLIQSAALIDARFDRLANGAVRHLLDDQNGDMTPDALSFALALAELGDPHGVILLADLLTADVPMVFAPDVYFRPLAASGIPAATKFFRQRLADYRAGAEDRWSLAQSGVAPPPVPGQAILPYAILALSGEDMAELDNLPLDIFAINNRMLPLVADPTGLFALFAGTGERHGTHGAIATKSGLDDAFCLAQSFRGPDEAQSIYESLTNTLIVAETGGVAEDPQVRGNWYLTTGLASAQCRTSNDVITQYMKFSEPDAEGKFFANERPNSWAQRPSRILAMMQEFSTSGTGLSTIGADTLAPAELDWLVPTTGANAAVYRELFLAKTKLLSNAYVVNRIYPDGAERRTMLRRLEGDDDSFGIFAVVDAKPRIKDGILQIGVRIDTRTADANGLGSAISGKAAAAADDLANFAKNTIKRVTLKSGSERLEMVFSGTTNSGVHVYEIQMPETGMADLTGHITLGLLETQWDLDLPLYASHFAFRSRLEAN